MESRRFAMSYKKRLCAMSYAGPQAEFSFMALYRRRPLVLNGSWDQTFHANVMAIESSCWRNAAQLKL